MKKYWTALLSLIASAIIYHFAVSFLPSSFGWIIRLLWLVIMIMFGYFLSPHNRKSNRWFGKVVIAIVIVFIVAYQLDIIAATEFRRLLSYVGLTDRFLDLLLIYCGWAFFQV